MDSQQAKNEDLATERVFRALGGVRPAAGFEDRILQKLAQNAQESERPAKRFVPSMPGIFYAAGSALALLVVLLSLHLWPRRPKSPLRERTIARLPSASSPVRDGPTQVLPTATENATQTRKALNPAPPKLVFRAHLETAISPIPMLTDSADEVATSRDLDRQALEDLHAESMPAPPLPPTAQERMVRLMLRRGEKHDLAQLDPAATTASFATEQVAFHNFFDPTPPQKPEGDSK